MREKTDKVVPKQRTTPTDDGVGRVAIYVHDGVEIHVNVNSPELAELHSRHLEMENHSTQAQIIPSQGISQKHPGPPGQKLCF